MEGTATEVVQNPAAATPPAEVVTPPAEESRPNSAPPEWVPRRMGELAAARRAAEQRAEQEASERARVAAENQRLQQELAQLRGGEAPTPHAVPAAPTVNIDELAQIRAQALVQQQQTAARVAEIEASGRQEFGAEFDTSIQNLTMAGVGGQAFLDVVTNVPNPEKLVTWLGRPENIGEAMRVAGMNPVQMGIEMMKLSGRVSKEMSKQVSKAPPPVDDVAGGTGGSGGGSEPKVGTPEWFEWRNRNARRGRR